MPDYWRPASFRGVPFFVDSFDAAGGRRGPDHEFPGRDQGYPEDTGGKIRTHTINAYVARSVRDPDYAARRDALIAAASQYGPGELVHPIWGTIRVQVREWTVSESKGALGIAPITLSFVDASEATYPTATRSVAAGILSAASKAHQAAANGFDAAFSVAGKSDFLRDRAVEDAGAMTAAYSRLATSYGVTMDSLHMTADLEAAIQLSTWADDGASVARAIEAFPAAVTAWHELPFANRRNADGTYRGINQWRGAGPLAVTAVTSLYRLFDFGLSVDAPAETATRRQQAVNAEAIAQMTRLSAAIEAARVAPFVDWQTVQEAETARDRISEALDRDADETEDDGLYNLLTDLRVLIGQAVPPENSQLPYLTDYRPLVTQPTLTLSYRLYGSTDRADEIAVINRIRHPGFVPGMELLQVISNGG
jgi:prophage DNA circulation protein